MTRSSEIVGRIRWMSALAASTLLAMFAVVALHQTGLPTIQNATVSSPAPAGISSPLDPRIATIAARHPAERVSTIVQFKGGVSADRARWDVTRATGHVFAALHIINALGVSLPAERARWLATNRDVHSISLNAAIRPQSLLPIPANQLGNLQTTYNQTLNLHPAFMRGYTGAGVGVAVIDTGIAGDLADFQASSNGDYQSSGGGNGSRVIATAVTNPNATTATDLYGHGTDVAGIIAGNGLNRPLSDPAYGQYIGTAPNANLISIKASDDLGNATVLDVIYGLQFAVDHKADYNIRVVNMSLDSATPQSYTTDPLDAAAESAWMHGIAVVAAAGNRGSATDAVQYAPANDPYVITVGAVNENGQTNPLNDTIAPWSSQGTTQDGFHKPDVYAPGVHIVSVLAPKSAFATMCPTCITGGGGYITTGGTSMAAPMISGLVADAFQYSPSLTPDQVKGALTTSWTSGSPSIQIPDAMRLARDWNPVSANQGLTPSTLITDASGTIDYARSTWSRSTWSTASGSLSAAFARSSWSCTCSATSTGAVADPSRSTWSRSTWSTYFDG